MMQESTKSVAKENSTATVPPGGRIARPLPLPRKEPRSYYVIGWAMLVVSAAVIPFEFPLWEAIYTSLILPFDFIVNSPLADIGLFSDIFGVLIILILVALFDKKRRVTLPYLLAAVAFSYFTAHVLKEVLGRARPMYVFPLEAIPASMEYSKDLAVEIERGKESWHPVWTGRPLTYSPVRSFPSGHAGTAIIMAHFLTQLYRRFWPLWWFLGIGTVLTRFLYLWHFPSDVFFAVAVGWLFGLYVFEKDWPLTLGKKIFRVT